MFMLVYPMLIGVAYKETTCDAYWTGRGYATGVIYLEGEFELTAAHEFGHK